MVRKIRSIRDIDLFEKKILLIVDFNMKDFKAPYKIDQTIPTIEYIINKGPSQLYIITHLGRPKNKEEYPTLPIYEILKEKLCQWEIEYKPIEAFLTTPHETKKGVAFGDNLRHYKEEQMNKLYEQFEIIVNDSFGTIHRNMQFRGYAGLLMEKEITILESAKECDLLIIGGAKADEKMKIARDFNVKAFFGGLIGLTKTEAEVSDLDEKITYPIDYKVVENGKVVIKKRKEITETENVIDIGPMSVERILEAIDKKKNILWNGPLGKFEDRNADSTRKIVQKLAKSTAKVITGGGETVTAIHEYSSIKDFYHVSTGGGAMLKYLSGGVLPGLQTITEE